MFSQDEQFDPEALALAACYRLLLQKYRERQEKRAASDDEQERIGSNNAKLNSRPSDDLSKTQLDSD